MATVIQQPYQKPEPTGLDWMNSLTGVMLQMGKLSEAQEANEIRREALEAELKMTKENQEIERAKIDIYQQQIDQEAEQFTKEFGLEQAEQKQAEDKWNMIKPYFNEITQSEIDMNKANAKQANAQAFEIRQSAISKQLDNENAKKTAFKEVEVEEKRLAAEKAQAINSEVKANVESFNMLKSIANNYNLADPEGKANAEKAMQAAVGENDILAGLIPSMVNDPGFSLEQGFNQMLATLDREQKNELFYAAFIKELGITPEKPKVDMGNVWELIDMYGPTISETLSNITGQNPTEITPAEQANYIYRIASGKSPIPENLGRELFRFQVVEEGGFLGFGKEKRYIPVGSSEEEKKEKPNKKDENLPVVKTAEDWEKLPAGTEYIGPTGKKQRKR